VLDEKTGFPRRAAAALRYVKRRVGNHAKMSLVSGFSYARVANMNREQVIAKLREHERQLRASGIMRLSLFGSVARGERGNDVDLIADYDRAKRLTLFDKAGFEVELADILSVKVDLCDREMLEGSVRVRAERESILVF
jgi:predicted nucleotidyltransferase